MYFKVYEYDFVIICLYIDDVLIFSANINAISEKKRLLSTNFDMKNLGEVDVILGIKITKSENGYILLLCRNLLRKFNSYNVIPTKTPYDSSLKIKIK